ncbi:uncharacterized protein EDB91DRAFT_1338387 [Suillus paluster]|uniref:uncharacterized protein n=1 Tax=Suillus paluster TaxID=48578 RepID=UPI001B875373|nr:uncharacterized protein EDB91DRAFT_1338387 [Suillus paluster]KAG1732211.1 hypothetical protein EDB91DRAFT_1338387 [Suillus paluster]
MASSPPKYDSMMQPTLPLWSSSKTQKNEVIVELSRTQPPPLLPIDLRGYVSPDKWETRIRAATRVASRYSKPMLERTWMFIVLMLTFIAPLVAYYDTLHYLNNGQDFNDEQEDRQDEFIWKARLIALGIIVGLWFVMFLPVVIWKHVGRVKVNNMIDSWSKDDVRSASSYAAIPTWKVTMPGMFRDVIVLAVSYPAPPSNFDYEAYLPPYIAPPTEAAPSYEVTKRLSGLQGDGKFGDIPLYEDAKEIAV